MTDYSDEELMSRVANQDGSAFEELYHRYKRRLFAFFYRLKWDVEEASDYTQETFLGLWKGRSSYAPRGKFSSYLFQIAKNQFLQQRRRQRARIETERFPEDGREETSEAMAGSGNGQNRAEANEISAAIGEAVASLPEMHRLVYVLSEEERMPYKEIAQILDCPVGTVSSRKVEAVKKLRKLLRHLRDDVSQG